RLAAVQTELTHPRLAVGTPEYMAPEQLPRTGRPGEEAAGVGPAADVYALGGILYCALTGHPPFQGETFFELAAQVLNADPVPPRPWPPGRSGHLGATCRGCREKDPRRRFASAVELADDLRRFLDGKPTHTRPPSLWGRGWRWARRHPAAAGLVGVSVLSGL